MGYCFLCSTIYALLQQEYRSNWLQPQRSLIPRSRGVQTFLLEGHTACYATVHGSDILRNVFVTGYILPQWFSTCGREPVSLGGVSRYFMCTSLWGQEFCFHYLFEANFCRHNKIWEDVTPECTLLHSCTTLALFEFRGLWWGCCDGARCKKFENHYQLIFFGHRPEMILKWPKK